MATNTAYRNNCTRPFKLDSVKTTYFESRNPKGKLIENEIRKAAIWGDMVIKLKSTGCFAKIKL